jgi:hypothetical protein
MTSLPEKSDSFQGLMLDLHFVCAKCLVNSLHIIAPDALPVHVAMVSSNFLAFILWRFLLCVPMLDTNSSFLVHSSCRIKDWLFPDLVKSWDVLLVNSGSIPLAHAPHLILRSS